MSEWGYLNNGEEFDKLATLLAGSLNNKVDVKEQTFTEGEKAQARANIGAISAADADDSKLRLANYIRAAESITEHKICIGDENGYKVAAGGVTFDITFPPVWAKETVLSGQTTDQFYYAAASVDVSDTVSSFTGTIGTVVYLVLSSVDGIVATIDSTPFTCTEPAAEDGKIYMPVGIMHSQTSCAFAPVRQLYMYQDGEFGMYGSGPIDGSRIIDGTVTAVKINAESVSAGTNTLQEAIGDIAYSQIDLQQQTISNNALNAVKARIIALANGTYTDQDFYGALSKIAFDTAENGEFDSLSADEINAGTRVTTENVVTENLSVTDTAAIHDLAAGDIKATTIGGTTGGTLTANIGVANIDELNADVDFRRVLDLNDLSRYYGMRVFRTGFNGELYIDRLELNNVQAMSVASRYLCIKTDDGKYYKLEIDPDTNEVYPVEYFPTQEEIEAGVTNDDFPIADTHLSETDLHATTLSAFEALITKLTAARIDVDQLFANEAFVHELTVGRIANELGRTLDLSSNTSISLAVTNGIRSTDFGSRNYIQRSRSLYWLDINNQNIHHFIIDNDPRVGYAIVGTTRVA